MEHGGPYRNFKGVKFNKNKGELDFLGIVRNRVWRISGSPFLSIARYIKNFDNHLQSAVVPHGDLCKRRCGSFRGQLGASFFF
jgi:hypothetical protein